MMRDKKEICLDQLATSPILPKSKQNAKQIEILFEDLKTEDTEFAELFEQTAPANSALYQFLCAALSLSPFLRHLVTSRPNDLIKIIVTPLETLISDLNAGVKNAWQHDSGQSTDAELMRNLRRAKNKLALALALYDLARLITVQQTSSYLSEFARNALQTSLRFLLLKAHNSEKIKLKNPETPDDQCGLFVLAMGKLGADELNYSSDIDLVVFFDPSANIACETQDNTTSFVKIIQRLIHIMAARTYDGYIFRMDMRLRPDPSATPLALPIDAAFQYYESRGQNWERAAFIKAKPVAGDLEAGKAFLRELRPFIYRKYLDYAAITDIHAIGQQIIEYRDLGDLQTKGHNVKLGRGGIRQIEFFAQTQQLIAGGRDSDLRCDRTEDALFALAQAGWIETVVAQQLTKSYWYLRNVEHRIQIWQDEQSHELPQNDADYALIAKMMGYKTVDIFSADLLDHLQYVEKIYANLFDIKAIENNDQTASKRPITANQLGAMGYERPKDALRVTQNWQSGAYRAFQTQIARDHVKNLTPDLLKAIADHSHENLADETLIRFDKFLSGLPQGIQLFSLLANNPKLLEFLIVIIGSAPKLGDEIARHPHIFDALLYPKQSSVLPNREELQNQLGAFLSTATEYEDILERLRIFNNEHLFLIGVRFLSGALSYNHAAKAYTSLAETILTATLDVVAQYMAEQHGHMKGGQMVLLAMGKLGSFEMTANSDLDIILIYDHEQNISQSDGKKPLDPAQYYTRLTQRLISAISALMGEGILYDIDLRLRPSGNKGPLATSFSAFEKYQRQDAWTWEYMALSRARIIGANSLAHKLNQTITNIFSTPRNLNNMRQDILKMRALMDREKPPQSQWDVKLMKGGLVDIEFITQYLSLKHMQLSHDEQNWEQNWRSAQSTIQTLKQLWYLTSQTQVQADLEIIENAYDLWNKISHITKLCIGKDAPEELPDGVYQLLLAQTGYANKDALRDDMKLLSEKVRILFEAILSEKNGSSIRP